MEIYNLKDKIKFLKEVTTLEYEEWSNHSGENKEKNINEKMEKIRSKLDDNDFCKLILVENDKLIGFISIFPEDCEECKYLTPWYATMYVKKEYRGKGYSKILNDAILNEAKNRKYERIYLKTTLINYYEKFGAEFIKKLKNGEKLYKFDLKNKENNYENRYYFRYT